MVEALRFGNADIALMDAGAAWVGWQQYGLEVLAADLEGAPEEVLEGVIDKSKM